MPFCPGGLVPKHGWPGAGVHVGEAVGGPLFVGGDVEIPPPGTQAWPGCGVQVGVGWVGCVGGGLVLVGGDDGAVPIGR